MVDLTQKTAIVTGASKGLGRKTAIELAKCGANVIVNYNSNREAAAEVVAEIQAIGGNAVAILGDVSTSEDVRQLFEQSISHFGTIDIVINNAGIMTTKLLKDFSEDEFDRQFAVNVKSVFLVMKMAAEKLEDNGRIITISSATSRLMMPTYSVYSATKAAVEQLTKVFAKEIGGRGITVNAVLPGPMNTDLFLEGKSPEMIDRIAALSAFGRIGEVSDITPMLTFLCSKEAQWITGQNLAVNGGMI